MLLLPALSPYMHMPRARNISHPSEGYKFSKEEQLKLAGVLTIPLLWMSAAGGTFFWVIGALIAIVTTHAALLPAQELGDMLLDGV